MSHLQTRVDKADVPLMDMLKEARQKYDIAFPQGTTQQRLSPTNWATLPVDPNQGREVPLTGLQMSPILDPFVDREPPLHGNVLYGAGLDKSNSDDSSDLELGDTYMDPEDACLDYSPDSGYDMMLEVSERT